MLLSAVSLKLKILKQWSDNPHDLAPAIALSAFIVWRSVYVAGSPERF